MYVKYVNSSHQPVPGTVHHCPREDILPAAVTALINGLVRGTPHFLGNSMINVFSYGISVDVMEIYGAGAVKRKFW